MQFNVMVNVNCKEKDFKGIVKKKEKSISARPVE